MAEVIISPYVFTRSRRAILAELHLPKRVIYQSEIYAALKEGLDEDLVKAYISHPDRTEAIMEEMREYPQLFDPRHYERTRPPRRVTFSVEEARQRIDVYESHFKGWSMYEVDGVYLNETPEKKHLPILERIDDERTQILKLIFRMESARETEAKASGCYDVLQAIIRWVMAEHGRLDHVYPWRRGELQRFLRVHGSWPRHKKAFVDNHYEFITKEVEKWVDDTGMFVFCFLIRKFWENVIATKSREVEIWTANFFNMNLNIVKETRSETTESA
ncbi:MAG: hypothetical protein Q8R39_00955 [bacterium]|nr:hypothetical protein [bacterium]MDZ4285156.1 hypothetical protein [Patescibacteria group bacterium]